MLNNYVVGYARVLGGGDAEIINARRRKRKVEETRTRLRLYYLCSAPVRRLTAYVRSNVDGSRRIRILKAPPSAFPQQLFIRTVSEQFKPERRNDYVTDF